MAFPKSGLQATARLSEAALCAWLGGAAAGDRLVYHRGFLAIDIASETRQLPDRERLELSRLALRARLLAEQGFAHLVQRRNGHGDFTYLLIAATRPRPATGGPCSVLDKLGGMRLAADAPDGPLAAIACTRSAHEFLHGS